MSYELGGSIILRDAFSQTLSGLASQVDANAELVQRLGAELDNLDAPTLDALLARLDRVGDEAVEAGHAMSKMGQTLQTQVAAERIHQLEVAIKSVQRQARNGVQLSVGDLGQLQAMQGELAQLKAGMELVSGGAKKTSGILMSLVAGFGAFGFAMGGQQLIAGAGALLQLGTEAKATEQIFRRLTEAQGMNADELLAEMQGMAQGGVAALDLMRQANRMALSLGKEGLMEMPKLVQGARAAGMAQGESTTFMLNSVVEGVRKASPELLDNLGLVLRVGEANQALADSLGVSVDALTAQQRAFALLKSASKGLDDFIVKIGMDSETSGDKLMSFGIAITEFKTVVGESLSESGLPAFFAWLSRGISQLTEDLKQKRELIEMEKQFAAAGMEDEARKVHLWFEIGGVNDEELERMKVTLQGLAQGESVQLDAVGASLANIVALSPDLNAVAPQISSMGAAALDVLPWLDRLGLALDAVVAQANRLMLIPDKAEGLGAAIGGIESKLVGLAGAVDRATLTQWRKKAIDDLSRTFDTMGDTTQFGMNLVVAEYMAGWDSVIDGVREKQRTVETDQTAHQKRLFDSAGSLQSAIEAALNANMEVTQADFDATAAGQYEDKVKEAALRLQAVAERGFGELQVHPDWAAALKIPEEVLAGSEAGLKAWAAKTATDVRDNVRPDLINWDRFVEDFKANMEREAAKGLTIDLAAAKLKESGVLEADSSEMRDRIAEALGLKAPELTIEAMFSTKPEAGAEIVSQITGGLPALPVPITPILATVGERVPHRGEEEEGAGESVSLPDLSGTAAAGSTAGAGAGAALLEGFSSAVTGADVGTIILAAWQASIFAKTQDFYDTGKEIGGEVSAGLLDAAKTDLAGFRGQLVAILLPPLEAAMRRKTGGKKELE